MQPGNLAEERWEGMQRRSQWSGRVGEDQALRSWQAPTAFKHI